MTLESFIFAHALKARLRNGVVKPVGISHYEIRGRINAPTVLAAIEVKVPRDFYYVLKRPPRVWCHEPWMRSEADWHNDRQSGLCWVLEEEWRDALAGPHLHRREVIHACVGWLMTNVESLISRHHYAHLTGRKKWSEDWDAWGHFGEGAKEYERAKSK